MVLAVLDMVADVQLDMDTVTVMDLVLFFLPAKMEQLQQEDGMDIPYTQ
jgi:sporulation protein YlmC with PRC-barrel domain